MNAYEEGYRNGEIDHRLGRRNDYAFFSCPADPPYTQEYSRGYRAGFLGLPFLYRVPQEVR